MSVHKIRSAHQPFHIIVRGRTLVLRANTKKVFLTNPPPWWLALYGYLQQLWCCVSILVLAGNSFWCYVRT